MLVNVEELHARWLSEYIEYTKKYLSIRHGPKNDIAAIMTLVPTDEFAFQSLGAFNLPAGAGRLILHMARFCRSTFSQPEYIRGLAPDTKELPEPTFCLNSLLTASFPINTETRVFKGHDCAIATGDLGEPDSAFRSAHIAFAGLGVILMNESRKILSPLSTDNEIVKLADSKYLSIIENKGDNEE
jgi:hypothetical protein